MSIKNILVGTILGALALGVFVLPTLADSNAITFESPTYNVGNINGQDGWTKTGSYDSAVVANTYGFSTFGGQSLRISNAVTSGSFGDQTFAKPLADAVGETIATAGSFSVGTRQTRFEMQFDIATTSTSEQSGLVLSVSPDRGDGSRMSYLRFEDKSGGIDVFFDDVQGTGNPASFVETKIGTGLTRTSPHTIRLVMDVVEGASNDVVKVWIDGSLVHTGTSWENYYRYDTEASAEQTPRIVKTVIFRAGGAAVPANLNNGFLFDNLNLQSLTPAMPSVPVINTPANGAIVPVSAMIKVDWTDSTGTFSPFEYQYEAYSDTGYTSSVYQSGWLTNSEIPTPGTPPGDYYVRVRARDAEGNMTEWSNGATAPYKITVIADPVATVTPTLTPTPTPVLVGPPTDKEACKKDGWMTFNNPAFKNQGDCVSYVQSSPNAIGNKTR